MLPAIGQMYGDLCNATQIIHGTPIRPCRRGISRGGGHQSTGPVMRMRLPQLLAVTIRSVGILADAPQYRSPLRWWVPDKNTGYNLYIGDLNWPHRYDGCTVSVTNGPVPKRADTCATSTANGDTPTSIARSAAS